MDTNRLGLTAADREKAVADLWADFVAVVRRLRRECPWDREQDHESVKHLLIEEAYEAVDAIDQEDWGDLKGELGDLLLHVVFHAEIAETTTGAFELEDVIRYELEKLVRRHPHVFGDTAVSGTGEVLRNWEAIKEAERAAEADRRGTDRRSALDGVPRHLPALLRAHRVQENAAGVGFDFPEAAGAWEKVEEEVRELRALVEAGASAAEREAEFGDVLFALVNYARFAGVTPENALRATVDKFQRRFTHVERRLAEQGRSLAEADLAEMDGYWDEAKGLEGGG
ncbi:MAG: nucleoside triphosphate pyrophosphohydrolase [Rhodothermales bacterium]|nr:nucleoside triphosphate pyrophosphohydrolase [Rhodothermales bacterium]